MFSYLSFPETSAFDTFPDYSEHQYSEPARPELTYVTYLVKYFAVTGICKAVLIGTYNAFFWALFQIK